MSRARRVIVPLAVLVLAALAWIFFARRAPVAGGRAGLEVLMGSPRGEVASLHSIDVVFNEPMVPLGSRGPSKRKPPLRITPKIDGSFSWIGSRALSFIPRSDVPPGTRVRCRVPRGTRSIDGHITSADAAWEIVVGRPQLVRSVPSMDGAVAPDLPIYLVFSLPPARGAEKSVTLAGAAGSVPLRKIEPDSAALRELFGRNLTPEKARTVLALRPEAPMLPAARYTLQISPSFPFGKDAVGLAAPIRISFSTYGPPQILYATGQERGVFVHLTGPVDADTLRSFLSFDPPAGRVTIHPSVGTDFAIEGDGFRPGTAYRMKLGRGLPSLLGARLTADEAASFETPHLSPTLRMTPSEGYFPLGGEIAIRIEAANTDSIEIFGAWVPGPSVPDRLDPRERKLGPVPLPRIGTWPAPAALPDSAMALQIPITRFGPPPAPGRVLQLRVKGRALYPDDEGNYQRFRQEGLVQITDLGISAVTSADRCLLWVTRLSTGEPVDGAEVFVLAPESKIGAAKARTDAEGLAWLPGIDALGLKGSRGVFFEVRSGDDASWLPMQSYELGTGDGAPEHTAFIFTDRPLYRPAETVRFVALARALERGFVRVPSPTRLPYTIDSPDGTEFRSGVLDLSASGIAEASVELPAGIPLGNYAITIRESEKPRARTIAMQMIDVEEYKLPRFQARLEAPKETALSGERVDLQGRFTYLGGGPLAGAAVRWTITRSPEWGRPPRFQAFSFQDERPWAMEEGSSTGGAMRVASGEGRLDDDGRITLPVTPDLAGLTQDQSYTVEMGARDLTDRSAYDAASFPVLRAAIRAGARASIVPDSSPERIEFSSIVLDLRDRPLAGTNVRWTVKKRTWKTVRVRRLGGIFGYENVPEDSLAASGTARSDTAASTFTWTPPTAGSYAFTVEATDAKGRKTSGRADVYVSGREAQWYRSDIQWVELKPDRGLYAPGDTARVLVPTPEMPVNALLLVLDQGLRTARFLPHLAHSPRIEIPLAGIEPSGAWAQAILAGPRVIPQGEGARERLPYHAWGRTPLSVSAEAHRLEVTAGTDRAVYEPRNEVTVTLSVLDASKHAVAGEATIAVVDDAIFELADIGPPDPVTTFFPMREPGAGYRDLRWDLHLPAKGEKGAISPGGDGGFEGAGVRRRFVTTPFWAARVPVDAKGRASVHFTLPDDLTRFRVRALVSSGADLFGYGETPFDVRKPLQLEWSAPRFVRDGDKPQVTALVRSGLSRGAPIRLRAEAEGARLEGRTSWKLEAGAAGFARQPVELREPKAGGVRLRLFAEGGSAKDAVEVTIPFDDPRFWEREFHAARVDSVSSTAIVTKDFPLPEEGGLTVTVTPSLLTGMNEAFDYVIDYPYGCLEQYSSMLLGVAARETARRHLGLPPAPDAGEKAARAAEGISRCVSDWMIHSWPSEDSGPASSYTVAYALYATTRAAGEGLPIPGPLRERLAQATEETVRSLFAARSDYPAAWLRILSEGPWLLWSLSEVEKSDAGGRDGKSGSNDRAPRDSGGKAPAPRLRLDDLEALLSSTQTISIESRLMLVLAAWNASERPGAGALRQSRASLASSLLDEIRARHLGRTGRHVWVNPSDPAWGDGIGGSERVTAFFVRFLATAAPADQDLPSSVAWLAEQRLPMSGAWENDHVSAIALDQIALAASALEGPPAPVSGALKTGGRTDSFRFARRDEVFRREIALPDLARLAGSAGQLPLSVETDGARPVYLEAALDRARRALDTPAREEGLIVEHTYMDAEGRPLEDRLPLGDPFFVHLAIVVSREARALVIEDPLPGGVEALNLDFRNAPRISMSESPEQKQPESYDLPIVYRELRDRSVRLFAEFVRPGVYHVYYPVAATAAGEYRVPGARAEFLYSPEINATSSPRTIRIERKR